jgi:hypothetical protein
MVLHVMESMGKRYEDFGLLFLMLLLSWVEQEK